VRDALSVDRSKLAAGAGARAALGMAIPLVVGAATGQLLMGVSASVGALSGGFASLQGTYRSRAGVIVAASGGMALSAFVGASAGHLLGPGIVLTAAWGFAAGILVAFGQAATVVGLQSVVGLVVFGQFSLGPGEAALQGALVLAGGLLQTLLVVAIWPLRRFPAERKALSQAYGVLASHARSLAGSPGRLLEPLALQGLDATMRDPQPLGEAGDMVAYRSLADQTERLRLELARLSQARQHLQEAGDEGGVRDLDAVTRAAGGLLDRVADAIGSGHAPSGLEADRQQLREALSHLDLLARRSGDDGSGWNEALAREARDAAQALAGTVRSVVRLAGVPAGKGNLPADPGAELASLVPRRPGTEVLRLGDRLEMLRANLTLGSEACRHAIRLAGTLALAAGVSHLVPLGHGYWLPMTVMIVLKPDFAATASRGVARSLGTLVGAALVTAVLAGLRPGPDALIGLTVGLYWAAITLLFANYAAFSICVASLVVALLAFTGQPEVALAADRAVYTLGGGFLALVAYLAWPTWERAVVAERLATLVETDARYGRAVLAAWADPSGPDPARLQRARLEARLARSNAEASVQRWLSEPSSPRGGNGAGLSPEVARGVLAAVHRYVRGVLALHAALVPSGPPHPEVAELASQVEEALSAVARNLRTGPGHGCLPPLRSTQLALAGGEGEGRGPSASVLATESDLIVDAVDTLGHLVGLRPPGEGLASTP